MNQYILRQMEYEKRISRLSIGVKFDRRRLLGISTADSWPIPSEKNRSTDMSLLLKIYSDWIWYELSRSILWWVNIQYYSSEGLFHSIRLLLGACDSKLKGQLTSHILETRFFKWATSIGHNARTFRLYHAYLHTFNKNLRKWMAIERFFLTG